MTETTKQWKERMTAKGQVNVNACPRCKSTGDHRPGCTVTPELAMKVKSR